MAIELEEANAFVEALHRHHQPVLNHRFSIGAERGAALVGVVIVGRAVARMTNQRTVVEVTRLCTDGTKNACSFLYAAAARAARERGYQEIQTFILDEETGVSLTASGWDFLSLSAGGDWDRINVSGNPNRTDQPMGPKKRYGKKLNPPSQWRESGSGLPAEVSVERLSQGLLDFGGVA